MPASDFTLVFVGDTSFGENYQEGYESRGGENILTTHGYAYSLTAMRPLLLDADVFIANLETPLTRHRVSPHKGKKSYIHWSDVKLAPECLVDHNLFAVSLANNHTLDYGTEGLRETFQSLDRYQIKRFGAGEDSEEAGNPLTFDVEAGGVSFPLAVFGGYELRRRYLRDYDFYATADSPGVSRLQGQEMAKRIADLKRESPETFVIAFPHWGINYRWRTPKQTRIGHELIDAGADLIVGHGAHMMGELERFKGKWIIYSIGNFVFNVKMRSNERDIPGLSFLSRLTFEDARNATMRLYPIVTDNAADYQARFATEEEFSRARSLIARHSPDSQAVMEQLSDGIDEFGRFISFAVS